MTSQEIIEKIKSACGDKVLKAEVTLGDAVVHVAPAAFFEVAKFLRDDLELAFNYLSHITGVDYLEMPGEPRFEAVYELHAIDHNHSIRVRVGLPEENPSVPTVIDLWPSATYPERELFDMYGINVKGHPNLTRLLMPEGWEGHPLRKDYPLTTEQVAFTHNIDFKREQVKAKVPERYKPGSL